MKKVNLEDFKKYVKESYTYADVCRKLGWKPQGGNYKYVKKHIKELELDISHFTGKATNICNKLGISKEKDVEEYLTTNSYIKASYLKWKLFSKGLKEYRCEKCGRTHWNGEQIVLQLHHINGDNTDNRLENLQILCPNCHSQTDNYCGANIDGANKDKVYYCRMCGEKIDKTPSGLCDKCYDKLCNGIIEFGVKGKQQIKSLNIKRDKKKGKCKICGSETSNKQITICPKCYHETRRKVERPSKEVLKDLIKNNSMVKLGKMFGVSDSAIRKWCKYYGLPHRKKDIKELA